MLIQVKYLGPTNHKPSRWKASRDGASVTIDKDGSDNDTIEDAKQAAYLLVKKFEDETASRSKDYQGKGKRGWGPLAYCGQTDQGLYIFASVSQLKRMVEKAEKTFEQATQESEG